MPNIVLLAVDIYAPGVNLPDLEDPLSSVEGTSVGE